MSDKFTDYLLLVSVQETESLHILPLKTVSCVYPVYI
jgi:hypothetical protein